MIKMANAKKTKISGIKKTGIYSLVLGSEKYEGTVNDIMTRFTKDFKLSGVYISLNKPSREVVRSLKKDRLDTSKILFLDSTLRKDECNTKKCVRVGDSVVSLSLAVSSAIKNNQAGFIFIDSINALLLYHDPEIVKDFISFFSEKMRYLNIPTVFMSVEDNSSRKFNPFLNKVCDLSIKI